MPVVIKELTIQSAQDAVDKLEARLKRLEQVLSVSGDPQVFGGITNLTIRASGSIRIEAGKDVEIKGATGASVGSGTSRVSVYSNKVTVDCASQLEFNATTVKFSTATFAVDAGMSRFSGTLRADTVITNTVVASTYTPGAGNVW